MRCGWIVRCRGCACHGWIDVIAYVGVDGGGEVVVLFRVLASEFVVADASAGGTPGSAVGGAGCATRVADARGEPGCGGWASAREEFGLGLGAGGGGGGRAGTGQGMWWICVWRWWAVVGVEFPYCRSIVITWSPIDEAIMNCAWSVDACAWLVGGEVDGISLSRGEV